MSSYSPIDQLTDELSAHFKLSPDLKTALHMLISKRHAKGHITKALYRRRDLLHQLHGVSKRNALLLHHQAYPESDLHQDAIDTLTATISGRLTKAASKFGIDLKEIIAMALEGYGLRHIASLTGYPRHAIEDLFADIRYSTSFGSADLFIYYSLIETHQ